MKQSINFKENNNVVRNDNLERFRKDMAQYSTISDSETNTLIIEAQKGDQTALNKVVCANLRIVWSIAKHYNGLDAFDDILQNANIGLIMAVKTFDVSRGTKLSTWILERVRQYINEGLTNESRVVRMHLGQIKAKKTYINTSFDAPLGSDEEGEKTLLDTFASDNKCDTFSEAHDAKVKINYLLNGLSDKEKAIVCGLFGIGCTEVSEYTLSKKFNICEERIRQIKWEALEKMKNML